MLHQEVLVPVECFLAQIYVPRNTVYKLLNTLAKAVLYHGVILDVEAHMPDHSDVKDGYARFDCQLL